MRIELNPDGTVLNAWDDDDPSAGGETYPEDTVILQETPGGKRRPNVPPRISRDQAPDWPTRAARQWNETTSLWESTGGQPQESDLERVVRLLRNNPVDQLPSSPTAAQIVDKVNELARHAEGRRKLWIRLLMFIGRRFFSG